MFLVTPDGLRRPARRAVTKPPTRELNGYALSRASFRNRAKAKAIVGESYEHSLQVGDDRRIRVFSIRICHDGRIFGAGWTDRSPWPLLHDLGHRRLRLQLYELCPVRA